MAVSESAVNSVLDEFYKENPGNGAKGARVTSLDRTWQKQLEFILERPKSYPNIVDRFCKQFKLEEPPKKSSELDAKQLKWWETEIMKQAGVPGGFMHVGGKAIDVGVGPVPADLKVKLHTKLTAKFKVLCEQGEKYDGVAPKDATCFHCT